MSAIPPVNATLTAVYRYEWASGLPVRVDRWSGAAPAHVLERSRAVATAEEVGSPFGAGVASAERYDVTTAELVIPSAVPVALGDYCVFTRSGEQHTRRAAAIEDHSDYGFLRIHTETTDG